MGKLLFMLFSQFLLILLQLVSGKLGWTLPWAELGAVYCALAFGSAWGAAAGTLSGMTLAILYGGSWNLLTVLFNPALAAGVGWWIERHDEDREFGFWAPGALAGLLAGVPAALVRLLDWSATGAWWPQAGYFGGRWLWTVLLSAAVFPGVILAGEAMMEFFGLPRFLNREGRVKS